MSTQPARNDRFENYVPVAERIDQFYEKHPQGRILTAIVEHNTEAGFILMRAEAYRTPDDAQPAATGHAFEERSGGPAQRTSYIEVCETSAVGRALALLGFEVKRGIASREEMQKADRQQGPRAVAQDKPALPAGVTQGASPRIVAISAVKHPVAQDEATQLTKIQEERIYMEATKAEVDADEECARVFKTAVQKLTREAAAAFIKHLMSGAPDVWA